MLKTGYDFMVDWWALGVLLYEFVAGAPPFYANNPYQVVGKIMNEEYPRHASFSKNLTSLLDGLLCKDPAKRLGCGPDGQEQI
eukprot:CAMPEP_0202959060 /NCGR_PEP_ID=MMETSP1396-20130829/3329_1 /ASSEMBLY_ACC=CAM_ASM_000872 /TAXON_ID= /ORGANISM="Pseudokeronopsis sp., Strain Brazil" /LENGTH=82 /DNA_ID=CAMNT_0049677459 /DNA_START=629 /DNA_END=877 /DNA_ORIENTATION=-